MPRQRDQIRDFPGKRWVNLALRAIQSLGLMVLQPTWGLAICWMMFGLSTLFSHAPGNVRHCKLF